jgi:hypothetical protein
MDGRTSAIPFCPDCDIDALAFVHAWALNGIEPAPP